MRLADLRYLTLSFRGFDGRPHTGELVVNATVAVGVVRVFRRLYAAGFPIEEMRRVPRAFVDAGWTWGGDFTSVSDLMHFSADGR